MLALPSVCPTVSSKACVIPVCPAVPQNSAYSDHPKAARVPREMSVSIVAARCLRFVHVATWNGQAPHTTTGAASVSDSHCQFGNCSAGAIAMAITGTDSARQINRRRRSAAAASSAGGWSSGSASGRVAR